MCNTVYETMVVFLLNNFRKACKFILCFMYKYIILNLLKSNVYIQKNYFNESVLVKLAELCIKQYVVLFTYVYLTVFFFNIKFNFLLIDVNVSFYKYSRSF